MLDHKAVPIAKITIPFNTAKSKVYMRDFLREG